MSALVSSPPTAPVLSAFRPAAGAVPRRRPLPAARPLRLTRRGRLVVRMGTGLLALVAAVLLVLAGVLAGGGVAAGTGQARPVPVVHHTVAPGETLWQIAVRADPGADPRDVVLRIVEANGLRDANVVAGARIVVPVSG